MSAKRPRLAGNPQRRLWLRPYADARRPIGAVSRIITGSMRTVALPFIAIRLYGSGASRRAQWRAFCTTKCVNNNSVISKPYPSEKIMKNILTSTFGAFLLGAAMLSAQTPAQTPAGGQGQPDQKPSGAETQPTTDRGAEPRQTTMRSGSSQTYTGCLSGSSGGGHTLTNIQSGSGSASASPRAGSSSSSSAVPGADSTSGSSAMSYNVMGGSSKADLTGMVGKRVEIVGTLSPEHGAGASSSTGTAGTTGASATGDKASGAGRTGNTTAGGNTSDTHSGMSSSAANRTLTITSIKTVTGSCSQ